MTPRLPRLTAGDVVRVLEKRGFALSRQSGSHRIYIDAAGRRVTVPFHAGVILHPKLLKSILQEAEINPDDLVSLL